MSGGAGDAAEAESHPREHYREGKQLPMGIQVKASGVLYCFLCGVAVPPHDALKAHVAGAKHQARACMTASERKKAIKRDRFENKIVKTKVEKKKELKKGGAVPADTDDGAVAPAEGESKQPPVATLTAEEKATQKAAKKEAKAAKKASRKAAKKAKREATASEGKKKPKKSADKWKSKKAARKAAKLAAQGVSTDAAATATAATAAASSSSSSSSASSSSDDDE